MPEKFRNKYRIASLRLQNWDYGWNGKYFITICTKDRVHFFGEIISPQQKMMLTETGKKVLEIWNEIPAHFPFVLLDEFLVMPNHIHGILIIDKPFNSKGNPGIVDHGREAINRPLYHN